MDEKKEEQKEVTEVATPADKVVEAKEEKQKEVTEATAPAEEAVEAKEKEVTQAAAPTEEAPEAKEEKKESAEATPPKEEKPKAEEKIIVYKKEKPTNCEECGKALTKKGWYYRNGKYFCKKSCWKSFDLKVKGEAEEAGG